jgi:hypothetical protein
MATTDLLRRVAILKRNPQYAQLLPHSDFVELASQVLTAFKTLQDAVADGRLKGEQGEPGRPGAQGAPGYSPIKEFESVVRGYEHRFVEFASEIEAKLAEIKSGEDGKDAEITPELMGRVAEMASALVELPDFESLVTTEIGRNGLAIIDAVRLSPENWQIDDVEGLQQRLDELVRYVGTASGGTIGKQQVYNWIRAAVSDGTIPTSSGAGVTSGATAPLTAPDVAGQLYVDTTNKRLFISFGAETFEDWRYVATTANPGAESIGLEDGSILTSEEGDVMVYE